MDYGPDMSNLTFSIAPLIERVKTVVTDPSGCWDIVSADSRGAKDLFKEFAVPMAVLGGLATLLGSFVSGVASVLGIGIVLVQFVSGVIMAFVATKVASWSGCSVSLDRAYSWLLHASMIGFVGGLASVIPVVGFVLGFLGSIGTLYWGWKGIGPMVSIPAEKRILFFVGTIVLSIVALVVFSLLLGSILVGFVEIPAASTLPS